MNTIKIYLTESGRIENLQKDFPLYQGQFQNKLLNVYVPTSIVAPSFKSQDANGATLAEYVATTSVKLGMTYTARNGTINVSKNYYMRFLKTLTYQNVEYALYERKLPKEFTLYAGTGDNAPVLILNVVNIDNQTNTVLSVITSQTCRLDVMESTDLDKDESVQPSELAVITGDINAINAVLLDKQDKDDNSIALTQFPNQKSVVGAINDIGGQVALNTTDISDNMGDIAALQADVTRLQNAIGSSETPVGQMTGDTLPTQEELTAFTVEKMERDPRPNDSIIFILETPDAANKNYKYIFDIEGVWNGYEIPSYEQAQNGELGVVQGTYAIGSSNDILVNIVNGEITLIFYKDNNGIYQNLRTKINLIDVLQTNIVNGTQVVGISTKALQDQLGNVINLTYAKQSDVYTKTESDNKYLPNTYTNIYYYAADGLVDDIPTTPSTGVQFNVSVAAVGSTNIFTCSRQLEANYNFNKNSTDVSAIWVEATNRNCTVQFRLTTTVKKQGQEAVLLSAELSNEIALVGGSPQLITIPAVYSALENTEYQATAGDTFTKSLDIIMTESTATTILVYSNTVYPSTFNLSAQSITFNVNTINGIKVVKIAQTDWTQHPVYHDYRITIPQSVHGQPPSANYFLTLQEAISAVVYSRIAFTPNINKDGDITIISEYPVECELLIASATENLIALMCNEVGVYATEPTATVEIETSKFNRTPKVGEQFFYLWVQGNAAYGCYYKVTTVTSQFTNSMKMQAEKLLVSGFDALEYSAFIENAATPTTGTQFGANKPLFNRAPLANESYMFYWHNTTNDLMFIVNGQYTSENETQYLFTVQSFVKITPEPIAIPYINLTNIPSTATQGVLTAEQLATLNDNPQETYIMFYGEKFIPMDIQDAMGYRVYTHHGESDGTKTETSKFIYLTLSTGGWVMNVNIMNPFIELPSTQDSGTLTESQLSTLTQSPQNSYIIKGQWKYRPTHISATQIVYSVIDMPNAGGERIIEINVTNRQWVHRVNAIERPIYFHYITLNCSTITSTGIHMTIPCGLSQSFTKDTLLDFLASHYDMRFPAFGKVAGKIIVGFNVCSADIEALTFYAVNSSTATLLNSLSSLVDYDVSYDTITTVTDYVYPAYLLMD